MRASLCTAVLWLLMASAGCTRQQPALSPRSAQSGQTVRLHTEQVSFDQAGNESVFLDDAPAFVFRVLDAHTVDFLVPVSAPGSRPLSVRDASGHIRASWPLEVKSSPVLGYEITLKDAIVLQIKRYPLTRPRPQIHPVGAHVHFSVVEGAAAEVIYSGFGSLSHEAPVEDSRLGTLDDSGVFQIQVPRSLLGSNRRLDISKIERDAGQPPPPGKKVLRLEEFGGQWVAIPLLQQSFQIQ